jgi:hypothetical protein
MLYFVIIAMLIMIILLVVKSQDIFGQMEYYKTEYEKVKERYLELHDELYVDDHKFENGTLTMNFKRKDCNNCGNYNCCYYNDTEEYPNPESVKTSPPCTGWKKGN